MKRRIAFALATLIVALGLLWVWPRRDGQWTRPAAAPASTAIGASASSANHSLAAIDSSSTMADTLNSPATDIRSDVRVISGILDAFRTNFPADGNPVGNNAEITAALTGRNRLRLALIPPHHPAINRAGELCDRWGTPFFFHAESGTKMEIRSAGPDRKMWTADDGVFAP